MPAHRKYTDAQRAEMFRLYELGYTGEEISEKCAVGTASVGPFNCPRRTVSHIVKEMEEERGGPLPKTLDDAEDVSLLNLLPARILRIVNRELDRFDEKTIRETKLSTEDLQKLDKLLAIADKLERKTPRPQRGTKSSPPSAPLSLTDLVAEAEESDAEAEALEEFFTPSSVPETDSDSSPLLADVIPDALPEGDPLGLGDPVAAVIDATVRHDTALLGAVLICGAEYPAAALQLARDGLDAIKAKQAAA
jgi:hypothetical protein